ncbi:MAG: hypothetical protein MMC33_000446 [Icmadophila ericetorum]|nr:hypothetical protein [Icmadophila ericetorum]
MGTDKPDKDFFKDWDLGLDVDDGEKNLEDSWSKACALILGSKEISEDERTLLENSSLKGLQVVLSELQSKHGKESNSRHLASKVHLKAIIAGLINLEGAVSAMANSNSVASLVWGSAMIVCRTAQKFLMAIDTLVDFLNRIGWALSRLQLYERLSSKAPRVVRRLNRMLIHIFVKHLSLCLYIRDSFVKDGIIRRRWRTTFKFGTEAFKGSLIEKISELDKLCGEAHQEAHLAVTTTLLESSIDAQMALASLDQLQKIRNDSEVKQQKLRDLEHAKRHFFQWLSPVAAEEDLEKLQEDQLDGTCEWIEDDELIASFLNLDHSNPSLLWISGGAGSGKSVVASHIVTLHDSPILPIAITSSSDEHRSPTISILKEILLGLQQYLKRSYLVVDGLDECVDDLQSFLKSCLALSREWSVLVVSRDVPNIRKGLGSGKFVHKTFTTSDNKVDINTFIQHRAISMQDTKEDINKFIHEKTAQLATTKSWQDLQVGIANTLSANAEGMFLWVRLVLDFLFEDATLESDVQFALDNVPLDLNGFYDKILAKMRANHSRWKIAQSALRWVIHGFRPLTVNELHGAISFESNNRKPINEFEEILRGSCGLLVRIDDTTKVVTIIHATVKEYLVSTAGIFGTETTGTECAHTEIAKTCLHYLKFTLKTDVYVDDNLEASEKRLLKCLEAALLDYSAIYWCQHLYKSQQKSILWKDGLPSLFCSEDMIVNWLQLFQYLHARSHPGTSESVEMLHSALHPQSDNSALEKALSLGDLSIFQIHLGLADGLRFVRWDRLFRGARDGPLCVPTILIAAYFDFVNVLQREVRRGRSIETKSHHGGAALLWAARGGSLHAARYILSQNPVVDDQSTYSHRTPLAESMFLEFNFLTYPGTYPIIQPLLEAGAMPDLKDRDHWNSLYLLVKSNNHDRDGELSAIKLLLMHSPDLWKTGHDTIGSILNQAVLSNKPNMLRAILEVVRDQDPENARKLLELRFRGDTILHLALQEKFEFLSILLDQGADVCAPDSRRSLPIQYAAQHNLALLIPLLLQYGCKVDAKGYWNKTPLVIALENQSMEAVTTLLDARADRNEVPKSAILLPRATDLDLRIEAFPTPEKSRPLRIRDIYQICFHFKKRHFLPIPVTALILDMAELWVQSTVFRDGIQLYDESVLQKSYLRTAPLVGRDEDPLQKIVYTINSRDQGWASEPPSSGNWTWFEHVLLRGRNTKVVSRSPILWNRRANREWCTHHIVLHRSDLRRYGRAAKPGDQISVDACASFRGWVNCVKDMRIDTFTSILRHHYNQSEISEIWDTAFHDQLQRSNILQKDMPEPGQLARRLRRSMNPNIRVIAAEYGTLDVTEPLSDLLTNRSRFELDTNAFDAYFSDPWPWVVKSFSMLYTLNGGEIHLLVTAQGNETVSLDSNMRKLAPVPQSDNALTHILAILYGMTEIKDEAVYKKMYATLAGKHHFLVNNEALGGDTWPNTAKTCVVYYRLQNGSVAFAAAREGEHLIV